MCHLEKCLPQRLIDDSGGDYGRLKTINIIAAKND